MNLRHETIPAVRLGVGSIIDSDNLYMVVGHMTIGPRWVTVRAYHPEANVYPNTPRRFAKWAYVKVIAS